MRLKAWEYRLKRIITRFWIPSYGEQVRSMPGNIQAETWFDRLMRSRRAQRLKEVAEKREKQKQMEELCSEMMEVDLEGQSDGVKGGEAGASDVVPHLGGVGGRAGIRGTIRRKDGDRAEWIQ
jgi:hypothetical protein